MDEILQFYQMLLGFAQNYGSQLSEQEQIMLAQFLEQFTAFVEQTANIAPISPTAPPIPQGMPSSNVAGMAYDDKSGDMFVQFLGKYPNRDGPVYKYGGVPKVVAELLQSGAVPARTKGQNRWGKWWPGKSPSAGASVDVLLKGSGIPYQKIS